MKKERKYREREQEEWENKNENRKQKMGGNKDRREIRRDRIERERREKERSVKSRLWEKYKYIWSKKNREALDKKKIRSTSGKIGEKDRNYKEKDEVG